MTAMVHPTSLINEYLSEKILEALPDYFTGQKMRFFPSLPTDINAVTEDFPETAGDVFAIYDRMLKIRHKTFPHTKCEQTVYYFYKVAGSPEALFEVIQVLHDLLDREDESAEELNAWIISKKQNGVVTVNGKDFAPVRFHSFKAYQLQETRDITVYGTTRTVNVSKIIVDYEYHKL